MRVYIETDIEGIAGFSFWPEKLVGGEIDRSKLRESQQRLLTYEVNAAVDGAVDAGAEEILVHDGHGMGFNILIEELHPRAHLIQGISAYAPNWQPLMNDRSIDAVIGIGGHVMKDTNGITPHTLFTVNKAIRLGEFHMTAALAGWFDIPFVFAGGDDCLEKQLRELVPDMEYVVTKKALSPYYAKHENPVEVRKKIRKGVCSALENRKKIQPYRIPGPYSVGILGSDFQDPECIAEGDDLWDVVMNVLESIYYFDRVRIDPWPITPHGPVLNKHQILAHNAGEKS